VDVNAQLAVWILLGIAMASAVLSAVGLLVSGDVYERLHYMSPVASVGVVAVAAAVVVQEFVSQAGLKAILMAAVIFFMNPILTHATARAARVHRLGQWQPKPEDNIPVIGEDQPQ
jgi:monovalent cation/proton antiporter MnhG/PhaG subunit